MILMKARLHLWFLLTFCLAVARGAMAQGTAFTYQGFLTARGVPATASNDFTFALFNAASGGAQSGSTVQTDGVVMSNGLFTVSLDFGSAPFDGTALWLQIATRPAGSSTFTNLTPRQLIAATPYAVRAGNATTFTGSVAASQLTGTLNEAQMPTNFARLTPSNTTQQATGVPVLSGSFITAANVTFGGSGYTTPPMVRVNAPSGSNAVITATVSNGVVTRLTVNNAGSGYTNGATLTIAAPPSNAYQTFPGTNIFSNAGNIFAGNGASLTGLWRLAGNAGADPANGNFLGTTDNLPLEVRVNGLRALRLEPVANDADHSNIVNIVAGSSANFVAPGIGGVTIGGGGAGSYFGGVYPNSVAADFGAIGGGIANTIQTGASYSTIGGGNENTIQTGVFESTIGGGVGNMIQTGAFESTIGGGLGNTIQPGAYDSAIGGGVYNTIRFGTYATIAGGDGNTVGNAASSKGTYANVGGGQNNAAEGNYATVPGGVLNYAAGAFSFAAGRRAKALNDGSFIWADATDADFGYPGANTFQVRASGGVLFYANSAASIGVYLAPGGNSWAPTSDRNAKENFRAIDPQEILAKVAALPVLDYNLKSQTNTIRHLGPMAQDFAAAFHLGEDDKHITTIDADGVALAAIQGLNLKLETENAALKARLEKLEKLVQKLADE